MLDGDVKRAMENVGQAIQVRHTDLGMQAPGEMQQSSLVRGNRGFPTNCAKLLARPACRDRLAGRLVTVYALNHVMIAPMLSTVATGSPSVA